jgi:PAS domain S-box-containing protein
VLPGDPLSVLLVEDSPSDAELIVRELRKTGRALTVERVEDAPAMREAFDRAWWDVVISDWSLPTFGALDALALVKERELDVPFIIVSGTVGDETAIEAMRLGAHDYVLKDRLARLVPAVERELRESQLRADRRNTQHALRESERSYRRIVETTNQGILVIDAAGRTTFANARLASMLGFEHHELLGISPLDLADPAMRNDMETSIGRTDAVQSERKLRRKDGSALWVLLEATPIYGANGRYEGAFAMLMDITQRKAAEDALFERSRIAEVTAEVGMALAQDDPLADSLARCTRAMVTYLDAAFAGVWLHDAQGDVLDLQASAGLPAQVEVQRIAVASIAGSLGQPYFTNEVASVPPLSSRPWVGPEGLVAFARLPLIVANHLIGVVAMFARRPLSEAVQKGLGSLADALAVGIQRRVAESDGRLLEAQLRQAQKLEAVGRLAGGVAHDMNNMLAVVLAYSDSVAASLAPDDPRSADFADIRAAVDRGSALTRQLLAFSRRQVLKPSVLDLNAVVANVLKMISALIGADVEVRPMLAPAPLWVEADAGQIEQVVMNLAVNARDAMPRGGELVLRTEDGDGRARLSVTDTGTGMDAATRERIFEPFFTTKEPGKGTGLGLATVFGIVSQSHGEITVRSELGQGTTFTIELPLVPEPVDRPEVRAGSLRVPRGAEMLLLVDDSASLRGALARALRARGYRVLEAGTGVDALQQCEAADYVVDLLVTDVVLPGLSGPEIARRLCDRQPNLRVLFISGYVDPNAPAGEMVGEHDFLQKPFAPDVLAARVREVLDRGRS